MLNFSTEGIVTDHLSLQISQLNTAQKFYAPRYWKAEWSEVDSMDPADDSKWHLIAEYTVPDISQWSNTLYSSIVGFKAMVSSISCVLSLKSSSGVIRFPPP